MQSEKIVAFGEIMMRLTPPDKLRFNQTDLLQVNYGGSEANVAVSLANYGLDSEFVTSLPANRIADACLDDLRSYRVGTGHLLRAGDRIGLYYMEESAALRNSHVVYDRSGSSFAQLRPGQIDWEAILRGATWFHWSGIAAAVSESTAAVCAEAVTTARRMCLTVSCDINFRKNLWRYGKRIDEVLPPMMEQCDVLFGTDEEYRRTLGVEFPAFEALDAAYELDTAGYETAAKEIACRCPRARAIVFALRNVLSANHHTISGTLYTQERLLRTRVYDIDPVIDCVGVGDAFVAGLIYGLIAHRDAPQEALDFGAAACALKNTVPGDYNQFSAEEVRTLATGSLSGRIAR